MLPISPFPCLRPLRPPSSWLCSGTSQPKTNLSALSRKSNPKWLPGSQPLYKTHIKLNKLNTTRSSIWAKSNKPLDMKIPNFMLQTISLEHRTILISERKKKKARPDLRCRRNSRWATMNPYCLMTTATFTKTKTNVRNTIFHCS